MDKSQLAQEIMNKAHLKGHFTLRSGQTSNEYFDKYQFEADPILLKSIAEHLKSQIPPETELLAGLEMGGIPIATALSLETNLPTLFVRKKSKDYGTEKLVEGPEFKNKKICLIEDVITTGGQVIESGQELIKRGAHLCGILCVIHRGQETHLKIQGQTFPITPLFTKHQLTP